MKLYGGERVSPGMIIVRQCGTPFQAGYQVKRAKDDTLFALAEGTVRFSGRRVHVDPVSG